MAEVIGEMCQAIVYSCPCNERGELILFLTVLWSLTLILLWMKQKECKALEEIINA